MRKELSYDPYKVVFFSNLRVNHMKSGKKRWMEPKFSVDVRQHGKEIAYFHEDSTINIEGVETRVPLATMRQFMRSTAGYEDCWDLRTLSEVVLEEFGIKRSKL